MNTNQLRTSLCKTEVLYWQQLNQSTSIFSYWYLNLSKPSPYWHHYYIYYYKPGYSVLHIKYPFLQNAHNPPTHKTGLASAVFDTGIPRLFVSFLWLVQVTNTTGYFLHPCIQKEIAVLKDKGIQETSELQSRRDTVVLKPTMKAKTN